MMTAPGLLIRNKQLTLLAWFLCLCLYGNAQVYVTRDADISFFSEAPLENIEAHSKNVQSILNTVNNEVAFIVNIRSFSFEKDLMQEHFNEKYMESDKYPTATFSGKVNEPVDYKKDSVYTVSATGKMKIHGVEKEITCAGIITVQNGSLSIESSFLVRLSDYDISIPRLLFENIAETVAVRLRINYQPYKK